MTDDKPDSIEQKLDAILRELRDMRLRLPRSPLDRALECSPHNCPPCTGACTIRTGAHSHGG